MSSRQKRSVRKKEMTQKRTDTASNRSLEARRRKWELDGNELLHSSCVHYRQDDILNFFPRQTHGKLNDGFLCFFFVNLCPLLHPSSSMTGFFLPRFFSLSLVAG
ncbi:hypothetical protein AVEN_39983-1 [Araneus ventricosus]|uniref:Uncharacterized protein n=1 Tax=Araneus ventricosus TaxID=182803 RepID=A0A4Y2JVE2_ARAVE|nr:hypothetical protein AVEN_39983-1 [Araneus ventricosus]